MKITTVLLLLTAVLSWTWPVSAHHPIALAYVEGKTQTVEGTLVLFELRNPHSVVYVDAPDRAGSTTRWTIEWLTVVQLNRQGVTVSTLKFGDRLIITGLPGRNPEEHRLLLRTITRPRDQWKWSGTFE